MYFYKKLYVTDSLSKTYKKVCWNLKHNRGQLDIYVIALSMGDDLFDIFHCANMKQKSFNRNDLHIIGIAKGYDEAVELVSQIVSEYHHKYGIMHFKEQFLQKEIKNFRR